MVAGAAFVVEVETRERKIAGRTRGDYGLVQVPSAFSMAIWLALGHCRGASFEYELNHC